ncbi:MAG TPA: MFS transporter, partial [Pseudothermotoga sp.]
IMIADIVDEDQVKTGKRREGMYFGANALVIRLGISLNSIIMGLVFSLSGYDATVSVDSQPPTVLVGFRILCSVVPIIATLIGVFVLRYYPLDGKYLEQIKQKVRMQEKV